MESPEEPQETPEKVEDEAPENEKRGFVNRILTLAGVKKRGEVFHRPAEVDEDYKAEIKNLNEALKNKDVELENLSKTLENKQADFETYKETQLREIEELKNTISNSISTLEDRIKTEVHNRLAALGYDADSLPAPQELQNTAAATLTDSERFLKELGLK